MGQSTVCKTDCDAGPGWANGRQGEAQVGEGGMAGLNQLQLEMPLATLLWTQVGTAES